MDLDQALSLKKSMEFQIKGKSLPLASNEVEIEGLFVAPSNPALFDKFINIFWREHVDQELFDDDIIKQIFHEVFVKIDLDLYIKLSLKKPNNSSYFLYEKFSNIVTNELQLAH